ncbi:MAG: AAA family ATPase [Clostridia bacterium]|nr:AAA family ATPase [Clostridia bacterium]
MIYLSHFRFLDNEEESDFRFCINQTCYTSYYPFFVLSKHGLTDLDFEAVTILYGGNGSGKTTALNVIAEKLKLERDTVYNRSSFFENYVQRCKLNTEHSIPQHSRIITSDDVFDYMLNLRNINQGIDNKREELFEQYYDDKYAKFQVKSLDDYEQLKRICLARSKTQSKYVKSRLTSNVREQSNGESAFMYFTNKIQENGLYLLDEPENSLSPERQIQLLKFLEDSARFFGCQFIIATHSPFLLSMRGAKIYDMDEETVDIKKWTELKNVRNYYDFFKSHEKEFDNKQ